MLIHYWCLPKPAPPLLFKKSKPPEAPPIELPMPPPIDEVMPPYKPPLPLPAIEKPPEPPPPYPPIRAVAVVEGKLLPPPPMIYLLAIPLKNCFPTPFPPFPTGTEYEFWLGYVIVFRGFVTLLLLVKKVGLGIACWPLPNYDLLLVWRFISKGPVAREGNSIEAPP